MTNREWLNTLSDEEFYNALENLIDKCEWCPEYDDGKMTCKDDHCVRNGIAWLQEPHDVTADEDFAEIGFELFGSGKDLLTYRQIGLHLTSGFRQLVIKREKNIYNGTWADELIDTVRPIADKKRKEMGW